MNPEAIQKIIDALEKNGGQALDALAAFKSASAYGELVLTAIAPLIFFGLVRVFLKSSKAFKDAQFDTPIEKAHMTVMLASGIAGAIFAVVTLIGIVALPNNIAAIKNPKGAAIYSLMSK